MHISLVNFPIVKAVNRVINPGIVWFINAIYNERAILSTLGTCSVYSKITPELFLLFFNEIWR